MDSPKKLRAAVVGVGYLGRFHAQKFKSCHGVELVGVCDFDSNQGQKVAEELGVPFFSQPEELLNRVDLVSIAASTKAHGQLSRIFLNKQIPVLVEKPIAATLEEAEVLVQLAEKNKTSLAVGHIERFNPSVQWIREEIKKNPQHLKSLEFVRQGSFKLRGADVSVLHDLMIHDLDLLLWMTDSDIDTFEAVGTEVATSQTDVAQVFFKMKNGVQAYIRVNRVAVSAERSIAAVLKNSTLFANTGTQEVFKSSRGSSSEPVAVQSQTLDKKDALQLEIESFVQAIQKRSPVAVSGGEGLRALRWVELIHQKMNRG